MFQTECAGCGLSVHDLPDDLGDREAVLDQFWADPRGVDVHRMSMQAVCVALRFPTLTRDQIEQAGVPVEAVPLSDLVIAS